MSLKLTRTALELYANLCGQGIGASGKFRTLLCSDISSDSELVFRHLQQKGQLHHPEDVFVRGDIRNLHFDGMQQAQPKLTRRNLDFLFGGPPCFRVTKLSTKYRSLFHPMNMLMFEFIRLIDEARPKAFWMEQVEALLDKDMEPLWVALSTAFDSLEEYDWVFDVLDAANHGGFQSRERVTVIGFRKDLGITPGFPKKQPVDLSKQSAFAVIGAEKFYADQFRSKPRAPKCGYSNVFSTMTSGTVRVFRNRKWEDLTIADRLKLAHMDHLDLSILPQTTLRKMLGMMVIPPFAEAVSGYVYNRLEEAEASLILKR